MSQLVINDNITIYDLALQTGYTLDYIYKLIQENSILANVNTAPPKLNVVNFDNTFVPKKVPTLTLKQNKLASDVDTLLKLDGQSIYDICLQSYGTLDFVYKLIQGNNLTNVDDTIPTGKKLSFKISDVVDYSIYKQFKKYSTSVTSIPILPPPTTLVTLAIGVHFQLSGIGHASLMPPTFHSVPRAAA